MVRTPHLATWRARVLAGAIDGLGAAVLGLLLASTLGTWCASRTVALLHIGQAHSVWRGPLPLVLGVLGDIVYALPVLLLLVVLPEVLGAGGLGKQCVGLRIVSAPAAQPGPDDAASLQRPTAGRRVSSWPLAQRFALKCLPCLLWCVGLLVPFSVLALGCALSAAAVLLGAVPLFWGGTVLHDRLAHTQVVRNPTRNV